MLRIGKLAFGVMFIASQVFAGGEESWSSVAEHSSIAFGSVKKDVVGEVHHFDSVSGTVKADGSVSIMIDVTSVETNIEIRNERMLKHVFSDGLALAKIEGSIDMSDVNGLDIGSTDVVDFEGVLTLAGVPADIEAEMLVARLSENRVLVTTADFIMVSTADLGIDPGIDQLMALAKLPSITRVTPVTIRMVFEK